MANFSDSSGGRTHAAEGGSAPFFGLLQRYTFSLCASKQQSATTGTEKPLLFNLREPKMALCAQRNGKSCAAEILPQRLSGPVR